MAVVVEPLGTAAVAPCSDASTEQFEALSQGKHAALWRDCCIRIGGADGPRILLHGDELGTAATVVPAIRRMGMYHLPSFAPAETASATKRPRAASPDSNRPLPSAPGTEGANDTADEPRAKRARSGTGSSPSATSPSSSALESALALARQKGAEARARLAQSRFERIHREVAADERARVEAKRQEVLAAGAAGAEAKRNNWAGVGLEPEDARKFFRLAGAKGRADSLAAQATGNEAGGDKEASRVSAEEHKRRLEEMERVYAMGAVQRGGRAGLR